MSKTIQTKVEIEKHQLDCKIENLKIFLKKENVIAMVGSRQHILLNQQLDAMKIYQDILAQRLADFHQQDNPRS